MADLSNETLKFLVLPPTKTPARNPSILFVDDESSIRATLPLVLHKAGFDVTTASTVAEAESQIKKRKFDALLTDLNIAGPGDGYKLVRLVREVNARQR